MKGCRIPAPAPWASTKHALDSRGAINIPETRVASSTAISTDCESAVAMGGQYAPGQPARGLPLERVARRIASEREPALAAYSFHGSLFLSRCGAVLTVNEGGDRSFFKSRQATGIDTVAPSRARGDSSATAVDTRSFRR